MPKNTDYQRQYYLEHTKPKRLKERLKQEASRPRPIRDDTPDKARERYLAGGFGVYGSKEAKQRYEDYSQKFKIITVKDKSLGWLKVLVLEANLGGKE